MGAQNSDSLPGQKLLNDGEVATLDIQPRHVGILYSEYGVEGVYDSTSALASKIRELRTYGAYRTAMVSVEILRVNG